jgi:rhodanese-related sulfurtransferase
VKRVDIAQLETLMEKNETSVLDANNETTRAKYGAIPGAVLLPSSSDYPLEALPADKQRMLVFYCANPRCGASETAAHRAVDAGYGNVAVLPDGIMGWVKAGKPTTPVSRS